MYARTLSTATRLPHAPPGAHRLDASPHTGAAHAAPAACERLGQAHAAEVLEFLSARPLHTVYLAGLVRDNGLVSPANRGDFYGCRDEEGRLTGVALIGHAIVFEARTESAVESFARRAQEFAGAHLLLGEREKIESFWHYYAGAGQQPRRAAREILFEQTWPVGLLEPSASLRPATAADLPLVVPVHAQMAFEESGVNPLESDPEGFTRRCARRIEQGRVWVSVTDGRLDFKADVISEGPEATYLEGVYVAPGMRGRGFGARCLSQLSRTLLAGTRSLAVLVNERNEGALKLYRRAGFRPRGVYDSIFLRKR